MRTMKKIAPHREPAAIHALSTIAPSGDGEGGVEKCKTTIQPLPGKKPNWRCGAPSGNRNAAKAIPTLSTIQRRIRELKKRARIAIALSDAAMESARKRQKTASGGTSP